VGELTTKSLVGEPASAAGADQLLGVDADADPEDASSDRKPPSATATPAIIVCFIRAF
jgi:hypothetical protein